MLIGSQVVISRCRLVLQLLLSFPSPQLSHLSLNLWFRGIIPIPRNTDGDGVYGDVLKSIS